MQKTRRLTTAAIFTAVMLILGYLESLLPAFFGIPGIKPGFANIPVLTALFILDFKLAAAMSVTRVILSGLTFSGMSACIYSLAGAVLSLLVMGLLKKTGRFSAIGLSIAGGVFHNFGQILVAYFVVGPAVISYFPVLVVSGMLAGTVTGLIAGILVRHLPKSVTGL